MREAGLAGVSRRKGPRTTCRAPKARPAPDLVERRFEAEAPDRLWVADITYVPTAAGFLYLAVVLDVFSRRVVGWAMADHLRTEGKFRLLRKLALKCRLLRKLALKCRLLRKLALKCRLLRKLALKCRLLRKLALKCRLLRKLALKCRLLRKLAWCSMRWTWRWDNDARPRSSITPTKAASTPRSPSVNAAANGAWRRRWARWGDCYDNAMAESFFATLECELLDRTRFQDHRPSTKGDLRVHRRMV